MTTIYYDATLPDWSPGPLGRDASELARITASPKGWIYTPAAPNADQVEVIKALRQLDSKITAGTDAETLPTFTAAFTSSAHTGGVLSTIAVGTAGTGYATPNTNIACTFDAAHGSAPEATVHATSDNFGALATFVVDTAGVGYTSWPSVVVGGAGSNGTGLVKMIPVTFTISDAGTGYTPGSVPLTFTLGGATTQATGHAVADGAGNITSIVLDTPGSGYTSAPTITIDPPGAGVTATASVATYEVFVISVDVAGTNYGTVNSAIPVTVTLGGASVQATAHGVSNTGGAIASFVVDTGGTGYLFTPTVTVGGTGTLGTGNPAITAFDVVTAAVLKITLTASEDMNVAGTPSIAVTIGAATRSFVYSAGDSTATELVFKYTVVAGDAALITEVVSGAAVTFGTYDGIGDVLTATGGTNWLTAVTFTAPSLLNVAVN